MGSSLHQIIKYWLSVHQLTFTRLLGTPISENETTTTKMNNYFNFCSSVHLWIRTHQLGAKDRYSSQSTLLNYAIITVSSIRKVAELQTLLTPGEAGASKHLEGDIWHEWGSFSNKYSNYWSVLCQLKVIFHSYSERFPLFLKQDHH